MAGKNFVLGLIASFGLMLMLFGAPQEAKAQCCAPPPPCCAAPTPPCCTAPPPCCQPPAPPPSSPPCCTPGHNINIPSVNVFVGGAVVVNTQLNVQAAAGAQAGASSTVFVGGGGGGGGGYVGPGATALIQGLNVEGGEGMRRASYDASRTRVTRVVIQAFCFDDLNSPHPASQVIPGREVDDSYDGELYRCIAGTHMQYTIAEWNGRVDFSGGETITCARGEALYHSPGRGGRHGAAGGDEGASLECRPQRPARDCNERSLLRRYGAGIKILTIVRVEHYQAYREEHYQQSSSSASMSSFSMDGGVGGIAY